MAIDGARLPTLFDDDLVGEGLEMVNRAVNRIRKHPRFHALLNQIDERR
jgi:hypothetical protein